MLAEAGFPDGFKTKMTVRDLFRDYLPEQNVVAVEFRTQLRDHPGIEAEVVVVVPGGVRTLPAHSFGGSIESRPPSVARTAGLIMPAGPPLSGSHNLTCAALRSLLPPSRLH